MTPTQAIALALEISEMYLRTMTKIASPQELEEIRTRVTALIKERVAICEGVPSKAENTSSPASGEGK